MAVLSWFEFNKTVICSLQSSSPAPETTDTSPDTAAVVVFVLCMQQASSIGPVLV